MDKTSLRSVYSPFHSSFLTFFPYSLLPIVNHRAFLKIFLVPFTIFSDTSALLSSTFATLIVFLSYNCTLKLSFRDRTLSHFLAVVSRYLVIISNKHNSINILHTHLSYYSSQMHGSLINSHKCTALFLTVTVLKHSYYFIRTAQLLLLTDVKLSHYFGRTAQLFLLTDEQINRYFSSSNSLDVT